MAFPVHLASNPVLGKIQEDRVCPGAVLLTFQCASTSLGEGLFWSRCFWFSRSRMQPQSLHFGHFQVMLVLLWDSLAQCHQHTHWSETCVWPCHLPAVQPWADFPVSLISHLDNDNEPYPISRGEGFRWDHTRKARSKTQTPSKLGSLSSPISTLDRGGNSGSLEALSSLGWVRNFPS